MIIMLYLEEDKKRSDTSKHQLNQAAATRFRRNPKNVKDSSGIWIKYRQLSPSWLTVQSIVFSDPVF